MLSFSESIPETLKVWLAVKVKFKCEKLTATELTKKGIENYLPLYERERKYGKRIRKSIIPLINSYVFVCIDRSQYTEVLTTQHVFSYLKIGDQLVKVTIEEIDLMKKLTGEKIEIFEEGQVAFEIGNTVKIIAGNLTGISGRIIDIKNNKKLIVQLQSMGLQLAVELSKDSVYQ